MSSWPEHVLTRLGGLNNWIASLEKNAENRDELIGIFEKQTAELKVDQLPVRNLIGNNIIIKQPEEIFTFNL
ncbi:hypothetical protein [Gottfriedia acidiceleris]|uniref:hypothetical protein n=1 Tax=Gottfriedia acidiceleris TaxID=371036 RepID=UPI0030004FE2